MPETLSKITSIITETISQHSQIVDRLLTDTEFIKSVYQSAMLIAESLELGGKLMLFGNGGSAADAQHIAAEFVNRFQMDRIPLPAIALTTDSSIITSIGNDFGFDQIFKKQIMALAKKYDVAFGISTSGKSKNVIDALYWASDNQIQTVGLFGSLPIKEGQYCFYSCYSHSIIILSSYTARVQEMHIMVGHIICDIVERLLFEKDQVSENG